MSFFSFFFCLLSGQVGNIITTRNADRIEFEKILVRIINRTKKHFHIHIYVYTINKILKLYYYIELRYKHNEDFN